MQEEEVRDCGRRKTVRHGKKVETAATAAVVVGVEHITATGRNAQDCGGSGGGSGNQYILSGGSADFHGFSTSAYCSVT